MRKEKGRLKILSSDTFDVHMSDLQHGRAKLSQYQGLVACGGFSYGDTLGAGEGWARSVLRSEEHTSKLQSQ